jgi:two-component system sensor histidine kinase FlrB
MNPSMVQLERPGAAARRAAPPLYSRPEPRMPQARRVLDALPAGVVVIDATGRVADANATALDLLGAPLVGARWRDVIARAFAPGVVAEGPVLADGRVVTVATAPLGDGPGQVVLLQDITQQRVMQELARRHQRLSSIGEMVASLSHQIRTPLASALLYLSQLENDGLASEARRRCLERARACLGHLDKLTRDMLAFAGGGALSAETFSAASLAHDFRQLISTPIEAAGCRLEVIDHSRGAALRGNRHALLTALQNIAENALHACAAGRARGPAGGDLRLLLRRIEGQGGLGALEILLTDDGPGIAPDIRGRVTEPFFTTKPRGTGLGLAVVRAVVQAHQGAMWIDSEPGMGTTVGLRLPLDGMGEGRA